MKVRLSEYSERWALLFQHEANFLSTIFGDEAIRFEPENGVFPAGGCSEKAETTGRIIFISINRETLTSSGTLRLETT